MAKIDRSEKDVVETTTLAEFEKMILVLINQHHYHKNTKRNRLIDMIDLLQR